MSRFFFLCCLFITLSATHSAAQALLSGKVLSQKDQQAIVGANVFIANSTIGTITESDGTFQLDNIPSGPIKLVVSYLGYESYITSREIKAGQQYNVEVRLRPTAIDLDAVEVISLNERKRNRYIKTFMHAFFGKTKNARDCQLLNPDAISLTPGKGGDFTATANELLEIENLALGYKVFFLLSHFSKEGQAVSYSGKPLFHPLEPQDEKQFAQWQRNRALTYNGSIRHFLQSLFQNNLAADGFEVYLARLNADNNFTILGPAAPDKIITNTSNDSKKNLSLNTFLQVIYRNEEDKISRVVSRDNISGATSLGQAAEADMINQEKNNLKGSSGNNSQVSFLFTRTSRVEFHQNGFFTKPEHIKEYGYWGYEGVADLLPLEYKVSKPETSSPLHHLLGFELSDLRIPFDEIQKGGPPKDGIPSIDRPKFLNREDVSFLKESDRVLGVEVNGITKAYPIKILNYHEIVNDQFAEQAIAITYCPLCGSGIAFDTGNPQDQRTFGVSGLLYNSDVLLYDRQTGSLWSQIMMEAISGPASGQKLQFIPTENTTWEAWKAAHPNTLVLSTNTGYKRDYNSEPYTAYEQNDQLMFPVSKKSNQLKNKDYIIGIEVNGHYKAYPFNVLKKKESEINDEFQHQQLHIQYDKKNETAKVLDEKGMIYPAVVMYWFAWYAFHPETEVFK
ncbi:MAG: DUF3179 domain-containing protein [Chitinophagales bacterium]|nr:DUF3179 domain-containing protein [Chitinophagales bacterium]